MIRPRFIHLRVHSDYSMIDGLAKAESLVNKAVALGMPALAITDLTNLCSLIKFYKSAHNAGVKPIIGVDFQVHSNKLLADEVTQITALAMNNRGYHNLILLISRAYKQGYNLAGPWIERQWLMEFGEGLLLLFGNKSDIGKNLTYGNTTLIKKSIAFYMKYFSDRFYLELTRIGHPKEEIYIQSALALAETYNLPIVATNDVRFINSDDFNAHEIRVAIHDGFTLEDPKRPCNYSPQQYMRSEDEMCELFADIPEALINSVEIAKRCNVTIRLGEYYLPKFPTKNMSTQDFLIMKSKTGLQERLKFLFPNKEERKKNSFKYYKRLDMELKIINQMGFPSYFLIVMEFIQWSKDNFIPVGPGRGSGAGSLVAYALKITDIDPLKFNLLFERFLNPERISMPDFDIDFCMEKRDQVIEHVANIYGCDAVSQIITFSTMAAKVVIRDVGRVLGYQYGFVDRIAKLIPSDPGITLNKAFELEPQLLEIYKKDEEVKVLIDMARKLEGITRNIGKHAGGVVIAPTKITDFMPLFYDETGQHPVTQFDKTDVEYVGLVKFDFLGLRTLTIINHALNMINKSREKNGKLILNINNISLDDKKSFEILKKSETTAIFQLESKGMKDLIKRLQPDCFEDIIALVALFRPGPLQSGMVDNFINRKHGREKISYPDAQWQHEMLIPVLKSTYGIILYQEQVMQIAQILSGYTLSGADLLRRAIGKKRPEDMIQQRLLFEEGARKKGINSELAVKIFDLVEKFAGYGFNKSHSAAYALISYQTLWLKAHYPAEFMSAVMTADMDNIDKIVMLVNECWRMKIKVLPPDINSSLYHFHVNEDGNIVYGMGAIKGVGRSHIEEIIAARNNGYFYDLFDLCARTNKKLNRRVIEKLILSGALDKLGTHRAALMYTLSNALKAANQHINTKITGQIDMFDSLATNGGNLTQIKQYQADCSPWSKQVILNGERETLGLYLTGHPINQYLKEIKYFIGNKKLKDVYLMRHNKITTVAGLVVAMKTTVTKNGERICICKLGDCSGYLNVILFTNVLHKYQQLIKKDRVLIIRGQIDCDNFSSELKMIARNVMNVTEISEKYARKLTVLLTDRQIKNKFVNKICQFLASCNSGNIPVCFFWKNEHTNVPLHFGTTWKIALNDRLLSDLRNLVGSEEQVDIEFN